MPSSFEHLFGDLEPPPPSAQRPSSTAAGVRARRIAVRASSRRLNPGRNGALPTRDCSDANSSPVVLPKATASTPDALTTADPASSSSLCTKHNGHHASSHVHNSSVSKHSPPSESQARAKHPSSITTAATPAARNFDPWNSSSTGHQRADNRLAASTSWRESRHLKLGVQFRSGLGGGRRVADTVGAGSEAFGKDGRKENGGWERGASGLRPGGQRSLVEVWGKSKGSSGSGPTRSKLESQEKRSVADVAEQEDEDVLTTEVASEFGGADVSMDDSSNENEFNEEMFADAPKQIFDGLCFYLNGSTAPLVSDHKLKRLLAERGGKMSIALGRRTVTHVILGHTSGRGGSGGGLAASKIQKEVARTGGKSVKFVTAEWVLGSIKVNRRLPESNFSTLKLAAPGQKSVAGMFRNG